MKIITINLPKPFNEALALLQQYGRIPSRSEGVRRALTEFLEKDDQFTNNLLPLNLMQLLENQPKNGGKKK